MKAVRYVDPAGATRIGRLDDERVVDAGPAGPIGFVPDDEGWAEVEAASGDEHALSDVQLLHPTHARKILAIGLNYRSHAEESELDVPAVPVVVTPKLLCASYHADAGSGQYCARSTMIGTVDVTCVATAALASVGSSCSTLIVLR